MDRGQTLDPITEDDIAYFLASTPGFFERHAELLASVQLSSPHGQRVISLQERQVELLRGKIHDLELRAAGMIRHGQDNVVIADKLQRWTQALLRARRVAELPALVVAELQTVFQLPQVALKLWGLAPEFAALDPAQGVDEPARAFAVALDQPCCGPNEGQAVLGWLDQPENVGSVALLPLRAHAAAPVFGLLVLASPDPQRFQTSMGTDFLRRLGELAGAALSQMLPPDPV